MLAKTGKMNMENKKSTSFHGRTCHYAMVDKYQEQGYNEFDEEH